MKIAPVLLMALKELERVLQGSLSGKQVDNIVSKINAFAIYSAIAGTASVFSGIGSVVAILTQTGLVWSLYVMINKEQWESHCLAVAGLLVIALCLLADPIHITSLCKPNRAGNCPVEKLLMANSPPCLFVCFSCQGKCSHE